MFYVQLFQNGILGKIFKYGIYSVIEESFNSAKVKYDLVSVRRDTNRDSRPLNRTKRQG